MRKELEAAIAAAQAAGAVLKEGFGREHAVEYKGEVDLVTEADRRAEGAVKTILQEAFPDYGMLTEESEETKGEADARWVVDPLDGTTNYAHGLPLFCVSIALERAGEVVLGVVHDPTAEETYAAERGGGATLNGRNARVSDTDEPVQALLSSSFSDDRDVVPLGLDLLGRFAPLVRGVRRLGCGALDLCYVAAGRLDACFEQGFSAWDVAAGSLLVEEAGGRVTDRWGNEPDIGGGGEGLMVSNGLLHPFLVGIADGDRDHGGAA